jgi:hypothetical protein
MNQPTPPEHDRLSPWPVRLLAFAVLIVIAIASISLIDERAMQRQMQLERRGFDDPLTHGHSYSRDELT